MVTDNGIPQLSSTTRIVITVDDINDHTPEFDQKFYKVQIPSNAKIDQALFQVNLIFHCSYICIVFLLSMKFLVKAICIGLNSDYILLLFTTKIIHLINQLKFKNEMNTQSVSNAIDIINQSFFFIGWLFQLGTLW